jgi:hypothetical protein
VRAAAAARAQGELWQPQGRIPWDWGFAGYMNGSIPVPAYKLPVAKNVVTDFGAKGDNRTDDTKVREPPIAQQVPNCTHTVCAALISSIHSATGRLHCKAWRCSSFGECVWLGCAPFALHPSSLRKC